jgi:hypothetical protein
VENREIQICSKLFVQHEFRAVKNELAIIRSVINYQMPLCNISSLYYTEKLHFICKSFHVFRGSGEKILMKHNIFGINIKHISLNMSYHVTLNTVTKRLGKVRYVFLKKQLE